MNADQLSAFYAMSSWASNLWIVWVTLTVTLSVLRIVEPSVLPRDLYKYNCIYFACYSVGLALAYILWSVW